MPTSRRVIKEPSDYSIQKKSSIALSTEYAVSSPNYGYVIPGENSDNWDTALNNNLDAIDKDLKTNYDGAYSNSLLASNLQTQSSYNLIVNPEFSVWAKTSNSSTIIGSNEDSSCVGWTLAVGSGSDPFDVRYIYRSGNANRALTCFTYGPDIGVSTPSGTKLYTHIERAKTLRNKTITFTVYFMITGSPSTDYIQLTIDDGTTASSGNITGVTGGWTKAVITKTISSTATFVRIDIELYMATYSDARTISISDPVLVVGNFSSGVEYKPRNMWEDWIRTSRYFSLVNNRNQSHYIAANTSVKNTYFVLPKCAKDYNGNTITPIARATDLTISGSTSSSLENSTTAGSFVHKITSSSSDFTGTTPDTEYTIYYRFG